ncbi:MAG TPA: hypothetical protein VGP82_09155 [Ktedonobacterales bacterium]|nr:hypothetical protein [Ktedonobacterales bacterium]
MITGLAGLVAVIALNVMLVQLQDERYYHRLRRLTDERTGLTPPFIAPPPPPPRKPRKRSAVAFRIGQAIGRFIARWS